MDAFEQNAILEAIPDGANVVVDAGGEFLGSQVSLQGVLLVVHRQHVSRSSDGRC